MRYKTKLILFALLVMAMMAALCVTAGAEEAAYTPIESFQYSVTDGSITIEDYTGEDAHVRIAPTYTVDGVECTVTEITGYLVKSGKLTIPCSAFMDNTAIASVEIPATVQRIGDTDSQFFSFYGCTSLMDVTILGTPTIAANTIGYQWNEATQADEPIEGVAIRAWSGDGQVISTAQQYATESGITFAPLEGTVKLLGHQPPADASGETLRIRFIAGVDSLAYQSIGFDIAEAHFDKTWNSQSKKVYHRLYATLSNGALDPNPTIDIDAYHEQGYTDINYLTAVILENIPNQTEVSFLVAPYVINSIGAKVYGTAARFDVSATGEIQPGKTVDTVHMVKFVDYDGRILRSEVVEDGKDATAPKTPARDKYVFDGWNGDFATVTSNRIVQATYRLAVEGPAVVVQDVTVSPETNTATVEIRIVNNPGIASMRFGVRYDESVLTIRPNGVLLPSVAAPEVWGGTSETTNPYSNPQIVNWIQAQADATGEGLFVTITFDISPEVTETTAVQITLVLDDHNIFNATGERIPFEAVNGVIIIQR